MKEVTAIAPGLFLLTLIIWWKLRSISDSINRLSDILENIAEQDNDDDNTE